MEQQVVVIKFGGGLITDKSKFCTPRLNVIDALAQVVARVVNSGLRVIVIHGAGSFGHLRSRRWKISEGILPPTVFPPTHTNNHANDHGRPSCSNQHEAVQCVRAEMLELNAHVCGALARHGLVTKTHVPHQLFNSTGEHFQGEVRSKFAKKGECVVDVTYGDVVDVSGQRKFGILSGDDLSARIAIEVENCVRLVFAVGGGVDGLLSIAPSLGGTNENLLESWCSSDGFASAVHDDAIDVTGGILLKATRGATVVQKRKEVLVTVVNGNMQERVFHCMLGYPVIGTRIVAAALWSRTASEIVNMLRTGEVTSLELVDVMEERIMKIDNLVNAVPIRCFERARQEIRERTHAYPPPLYGLPVLIKDLHAVRGLLDTHGFIPFQDRISSSDDALVKKLQEAGGIVCGKTNVPEHAAGSHTFNRVFGRTKNPWDLRVTAGGSSGGTAAALSSGMSWLATGSDLGGSLRIPASFNGIVGLRSSPGRVVQQNSNPPYIALHSVNGSMGRNVEDVGLFLDAMLTLPEKGWHEGEHVGIGHRFWTHLTSPSNSLLSSFTCFQQAALAGVAPKRVAFSKDLGLGRDLCPTSQRVAKLVRSAAQWYRTTGAVVEEGDALGLSVNTMREAARTSFLQQRASSFGRSYLPWKDDESGWWNHLKPEIKWNALQSYGNDDQQSRYLQSLVIKEMLQLFQRYDLIITPAVMILPFDGSMRYVKTVDGVELTAGYLGWMILSWIVTITNCPALVLPAGVDDETGLPIGMQLIGRPGDEGFLLSAGRLFEQAHNFVDMVPIVHPKIGARPLSTKVAGPKTVEEAHSHHFPQEVGMHKTRSSSSKL